LIFYPSRSVTCLNYDLSSKYMMFYSWPFRYAMIYLVTYYLSKIYSRSSYNNFHNKTEQKWPSSKTNRCKRYINCINFDNLEEDFANNCLQFWQFTLDAHDNELHCTCLSSDSFNDENMLNYPSFRRIELQKGLHSLQFWLKTL